VSRLVVVAPLRPGGAERARELLDAGPPFDLEGSPFEAHEVFVTPNEVVFVFDGGESSKALKLAAEDPAVWRAAKAWAECLEGRPRIAREAFSWKRGQASK
jgi:hypothetical protein